MPKRNGEQVGGSSVNLCRADNVVACLTDVGNSKHRCRLAGRCEHGCHAALQIADFLCYDVVRRVLQTGIEISLLLQIEQFSHFLAGCIFECCALVNRKYTRLTVFRLPSSLYTDCVLAVSHNFSPFCK